MNSINKDSLTKKLIFLSKNRGWRENDLLLGKFAEKQLNQFSTDELMIYHQFLNELDPDIFDWIVAKKSLPLKYQANIIYHLIKYNK